RDDAGARAGVPRRGRRGAGGDHPRRARRGGAAPAPQPSLRIPPLLGKALYGALFALLLPVLLWLWARALDGAVRAPLPAPPALGLGLAILGALVMVAGWIALRVHGGGLPMNAYPPPRYVDRGVYALFAHPIYVGFSGLCLGASLAARSPAGFWLV